MRVAAAVTVQARTKDGGAETSGLDGRKGLVGIRVHGQGHGHRGAPRLAGLRARADENWQHTAPLDCAVAVFIPVLRPAQRTFQLSS